MLKFRDTIKPLLPYVPGRPIDDVKREYELENVVKIASNENPYGCSPRAIEAVVAALSGASLYPDGNCTALRASLAKKHGVEQNQIIFGCGTDEIIAMVGKVFINEGDECITGNVSFSQYMASTIAMGGKMVYADMKNHGFDLDAILSKITDKTKVIFIANPNNPTGTIHTEAEQRAFIEKVPSNIFVAFDEAYAEFVDCPKYPKTFEYLKYPNVMLMKTFSKAYGLASFRVGYAFASAEIISMFEKIRNPFNVPTPAQAAAAAALEDTEFLAGVIEKNKEVRDYICGEFENMSLKYIPSSANFVMVDVKKDSRKIFVELMKNGYIIRPGAAFGMDTFLRVSLGTMDEMSGFIDILKKLLND